MAQSQGDIFEKNTLLSNDSKLSISLLSYRQADRNDFYKNTISSTDLPKIVNFVGGELAQSDNVSADIALAYFSPQDEINKYIADLATLHVGRKVPLVFALIHQDRADEIKSIENDIAADRIIYHPIESGAFDKFLKTHVVSLKIEQSKKGTRIDSVNKTSALGEILVSNKIITSLQLKKALDAQSGTSKRLGDVLVELGYIDEDQKLHFLASQLGVPIATSKQYTVVENTTVAIIPEHIAKKHHCLAIAINHQELFVAMTDVLDLKLLDTLRDVTDYTIKPVLGKLVDIDTTLERMYRDIASNKEVTELVPQMHDSVRFVSTEEEQVNLEQIAAAGAEVGIIRLVTTVIANAIRDRASDIHIEPLEKELIIRLRVDGELRKMMNSPKRTHQAIISRIKILSNLDIAERRLPQDGRMGIKVGTRQVDIRVSILPTIFGEKAVLRILDKEAFERNVSNLGFTEYDYQLFNSQIVKPYGMVIITGPTGSGKSTTLYAALQQIKNVSKNIVTVEDPVEFHIEEISQVQVNSKIGLTFSSTLRSVLRQDPDIILIGEIRDHETADIAIKMALTGHLVFSTLHTNDAASAILRFVDIGVPPLLLSSSLNLVVAQRLVRKICSKCKVAYDAPLELMEQLKLHKTTGLKFFQGVGCVQCHGTGYDGRTGIYEMIPISKAIRQLILRNVSTIEIAEQASAEGMKTLRQAGIDLICKGVTTLEEVIAVTTEM